MTALRLIRDADPRPPTVDVLDAMSTVVPVCPAWCESEPGHPYDSTLNDGTNRACRDHDVSVGGLEVASDPARPGQRQCIMIDVSATEIQDPDGVVTSPARIAISAEYVFLTVDETLQLASRLAQAAEVLRSIVGEA